jgi:kojibiose phosphorylase
MGYSPRSSAVATRGSGPSLAPELERPFRLVAFDWDGTAVASRHADATRVVAAIDGLLAAGARIAIITGTSFANVARQLGSGIGRDHARRLTVLTNRGSEAFGFDHRGAPELLYRRRATPEEERLLDAVADAVKDRLERRSGLAFPIIRDRLNRRKIDLVPDIHDPPKSAIAELLAATEARLSGAGLRAGLVEAMEVAERCARELGLEDARITSDVKHVEIGLTDKADSMRWVVAHVAAPLDIAPADMMVAGDEFGPIAGMPGSDSRMLDVPEVAGAVVVSVGPEPGGAPRGVLHPGGGPERFCEILERQIALDAELGPFAVPRDASWAIEEPGFDVAREHEIEALLAIANGYVGSRGSIAEGSSASRPGTFLAGAYEPAANGGGVPELLVLPDWGRLRFSIEGDPLSVESGQMMDHRRVLDMRRGLLLREGVERSAGGHVTRLRTMHLASLSERHLLVERVQVCPLNYSGSMRIEAILSGDVRSESGARHWVGFEPAEAAAGPALVGRTRDGLVVALASRLEVVNGARAGCARADSPGSAAERCEIALRLGERCELHRAVALASSRDSEEPRAAAEVRCAASAGEPSAAILARHVDAWAERWRRAGVTIDGEPRLERALRFALYHLISAANPDDPRVSIGARALTGEAYRGHVFWDTDIFMLPFFAHAYPEAARALVGYRQRTLPGAQRKAAAFGYQGALYAWESTDTGDETTPAAVVSPFGEIMPVLCGEQEQHISADVAYATCAYARVTGDRAALRGAGRDVLVETARFWASRVTRGPDGLFHILRVIGPDEYHEGVDDNAFTNWMARFNLRRGALAAAAGGGDGEARTFRAIADAMYLGLDERTGLIEQFRGFHALEMVDLAQIGLHHAPVDLVLGRERTARSQVIKQADVVMLLALLWDEVPPKVRRRCFLHYEPRTAHGSSLSPGVHALVAARLGLADEAMRYLEQTADIDLGNTMGNSAGGVHAAALGGLWQAVVLGVGGVRPAPDDAEALWIEPHLLPSIRHLGFPLTWRGRSLSVDIDGGGIEVSIEGDAPLAIRAVGAASATVQAEPGRRYAARREADRFAAWEAIA